MNIEWVINKAKEKFYPITHAKAVLFGDNNKTVEEEINNINATYIKGLSASGKTVTYTKGDGTTGTMTTQDTTYSNATTSTAGLMSAADKTKLDGIATGAEVNQNSFSNVVVGSTTISADSKTDSLTLAGSNVTITPDADNDKVTIGITKANVTSALGYTPPTTNTTYSDMTGATTDANGTHGLVPAPTKGAANRYLRSDGTWSVPPDNNTVYTHPTTSGNKHIPSGGSSGQILRWSADGTAVWGEESISSVSDDVVTISKNVNGCITFTGNNGYGLKTAKNDYGRIGESDKQFYEVYAHYLYEDGTRISNKYSTADNPVFTGTISSGRKNGTTSGAKSVALGYDVEASGDDSHAEGSHTTASGSYSHAEGYYTTASGEASHAEGRDTTASGKFSHAEGYYTTASGEASHAEGGSTTASGDDSHAEGSHTTASGSYSHAEGSHTTALTNQHAQGHYNNTTTAKENSTLGTSSGTAFVIGNGVNASSNSNAFRVTGQGYVYATNSSVQTGADYAEYFEWADGNPNEDDRVGYFVTFDENNPEKIRFANENDYILGIVSGMPSVIGNGDEDWKQRYILDDFGRYIEETFEYEQIVINKETGEENKVTKTGTKWKENPDYDCTKPYIPREERAEWSAIGMLGVLSVYDDGTCRVNGYCKCTDGGIATASESGYRVIKRVNNNIIKTVFK